jgi:hypothetical protein
MTLNIYHEHVLSSLDDFKTNYNQIIELENFLEKTSKKRLCILSGSLSTGKTSLLEYIQSTNNYETVLLTFDMDYHNIVNNFCSKSSIERFFTTSKIKIVLIDDIHLFDKQIITEIKKYKNVKIIVTVQTKEEAKVSELKTTTMSLETVYIKLKKISFQDCFILVSDLIDKLDLNDKVSIKMNIDTIKKNNCNLRQILQYLPAVNKNTVNDLTNALSNVSIQNNSTETSIQTPNVNDMNIYEITKYFLYNKINEKFLHINYYGMTNYLIHENFSNLFVHKRNDKKLCLDVYKTFLENTILINNDVLQQENHTAYTYLEYYSTHKINSSLLGLADINASIKFTSLFNKLSVQSTFNKKVINIKNENKLFEPYIRAMCVKDETTNFIRKKMKSDFSDV